MTYYAPAGTPVTLADIARGALAAPRDADVAVQAAMRRISGQPHAWTISSGRAAMTLILRAMAAARSDASKDEVIVPAYTCYSVPAAIERAGLRPRLCDIDPATLGMDVDALDRCDFSRVLAVVSANLYGLPNELHGIDAVCRRRGVYLLDDAAQALGSSLGDRAVGSFGAAGLYSFDKGKVISTIQGGAVVCGDAEVARQLERLTGEMPAAAAAESLGNGLKLVVYSIFLRPALYGLIHRLPFTGLGYTRYEPRYPIARLARWQAGVATRLLARLPQLQADRLRMAGAYQSTLEGIPGIDLVQPVPGSRPAFVRYPLRLRRPELRERALRALGRAGIGATASYPSSLADVPQVAARLPASGQAFPGAREVASTIMTLPTHAYCGPAVAERVRRELLQCLA